jgi:spore coat polysaccharide biosynthesis predicted glycosyltransferase SpsG
VFALCVESSHARGMGHFFRALNLVAALERAGQACKVLINAHEPALRLLENAGVKHITVDLTDLESDWEGRLIEKEDIRVWVNDRLNTDVRHSENVKRRGIPLVTFDDRGGGAAMADLNIVALAFDANEALPGRQVLRGVDYLILNPGIARHRRVRRHAKKLLVMLGGSDTHGVTVKVVHCLRAAGRAATVIVGPGFCHDAELAQVLGPEFEVKRGVPSLIAEFERYDLAITGAGITPFEANASGLPCIVIANEPFEVPVAQGLAKLGGSVFAGYHTEMDESILTHDLPVEAMSRAGMKRIGLEGADRVVRELMSL